MEASFRMTTLRYPLVPKLYLGTRGREAVAGISDGYHKCLQARFYCPLSPEPPGAGAVAGAGMLGIVIFW